jgi:hypothetical protein
MLGYPPHQHHIRQRFDHLQTPQASRHPQRQEAVKESNSALSFLIVQAH